IKGRRSEPVPKKRRRAHGGGGGSGRFKSLSHPGKDVAARRLSCVREKTAVPAVSSAFEASSDETSSATAALSNPLRLPLSLALTPRSPHCARPATRTPCCSTDSKGCATPRRPSSRIAPSHVDRPRHYSQQQRHRDDHHQDHQHRRRDRLPAPPPPPPTPRPPPHAAPPTARCTPPVRRSGSIRETRRPSHHPAFADFSSAAFASRSAFSPSFSSFSSSGVSSPISCSLFSLPTAPSSS